MENITDGFGAVTLWGFSPALDLQKELLASHHFDQESVQKTDELNILLAGAGDPRHLLKTLAEAYHHCKRKLNFFILEKSVHLYARQMLLLALVTDSPSVVGLQEKTELFLEIFGDSLLRAHTYQYMQSKAADFVRMVTDFEYLQNTFPFLCLENLKFKEIDDLEKVFKSWVMQDSTELDIFQHWDKRVRLHLGVRYDNRCGIYDWDYHMKLADKDAGVINPQQYCKWRNNGIAFEIREGHYSYPNPTLYSGLLVRCGGENHVEKGYWGDIVCSPYLAFGIEADDESFFKKENNKYVKSAQDISEYNVCKLLYEIQHQKKYIPGDLQSNIEYLKNKSETASDFVKVDWGKVNFLPIEAIPSLMKKEKFCNLFHIAYFSNSMIHLLKHRISSLLSPGATVVIETAKFMLDLRPQTLQEYANKVISIAKMNNCELIVPCDPRKDSFARFVYSADAHLPNNKEN